jgi:quinol monooxygenase YgiN
LKTSAISAASQVQIGLGAQPGKCRGQQEGHDMNPGCTLIAFLTGKPEKRQELLAVLRGFVNPTRAEAGCVEYHLHISDADPNLFFFYENWRTRKDLDEHLEMPYLKSFFERRMDLLEKEIDLQFMAMDSAYDK